MIGKKYLFKLYFSLFNVWRNDYTYRCQAVSDDKVLIDCFKTTFLREHEAYATPLTILCQQDCPSKALQRNLSWAHKGRKPKNLSGHLEVEGAVAMTRRGISLMLMSMKIRRMVIRAIRRNSLLK